MTCWLIWPTGRAFGNNLESTKERFLCVAYHDSCFSPLPVFAVLKLRSFERFTESRVN